MEDEARQTLTAAEGAKALGINVHLFYQLCRENQVPAIRLGAKRIVIPRKAFEDFLAGNWPPPAGNGNGSH